MYLGSPRMAEMVIGEKVTLEEMGGAKMHTGVSGCGHFLVKQRRGGDRPRQALPLLHAGQLARGAARRRRRPRPPPTRAIAAIVPADENQPFDMREVLDALLDADSFLEVHRRWAKELIVGYGRLDGRVVGVVANQPRAERRRPLRRLGRQGGPLHPDLQRLQRAAALPRRRARLHDRHRGRAPGDHPPRREDDQRRLRGDRAEALGDRPQGLRRRPLRDGRARPSSPTAASPCPAPRSR